jgi:hypothetical protein
MKAIRRQYRKYKVRIQLTKDGDYLYGLIYRPNGDFLCPTSTRFDEESIVAQAEDTIDQDIREQAAKAPAPIRMVAMCWKCQHGLWSKDLSMSLKGADASTFKGCALDTRIDTENKDTLCPLKKTSK